MPIWRGSALGHGQPPQGTGGRASVQLRSEKLYTCVGQVPGLFLPLPASTRRPHMNFPSIVAVTWRCDTFLGLWLEKQVVLNVLPCGREIAKRVGHLPYRSLLWLIPSTAYGLPTQAQPGVISEQAGCGPKLSVPSAWAGGHYLIRSHWEKGLGWAPYGQVARTGKLLREAA